MKKISKPLVSVIIPTFNRPQYFKLALESALNQTYRNIEVIVSDNSTNDETEELMQDYLAKDPRIKYFRHKDFTANDNWNFARHYNNPAAEYVNWLMDDDLFYPFKLELMIEVYRNNPDVSLVTSRRNYIDEHGNIIYQSMPIDDISNGERAGKLLFIAPQNNLLKIDATEVVGSNVFTPDNYIGGLTNILIKKKFLRGNDLCYFDNETGFYPLADVSTWLQLLRKGNMFYIDEPLSAIRYHSAQAMYNNGMNAIIAMCWSKLIKYFWDSKNFLTTEDDMRKAFFNWIDIAAIMLAESNSQNYHGHEVTALEDLNIAMAEALHNKGELHLPPSVQVELEKFR